MRSRLRSTSAEVLVVGGGPAGCAAAIAARRAGAQVVLLEREAAPRDRPGETLHPGIEPLLEQLGAVQALHAATLVRHDGHWVTFRGRRRFQAFGSDQRGIWRGFQAERKSLDAGLLTCAAGAGVEVRQGSGVSELRRARDGRVTGVVTSNGETIATEVVIDAAGGRHWLARQLGIGVRQLSPRYVATYGYASARDAAPHTVAGAGSAGRPTLSQYPQFSSDPAGWIWVAPLGQGRWHWTRLSFAGERMPDAWFPPLLGGLRPCGPSRGADMTWRMSRRLAGPGWFMAGDAAAVLDPASSHGVLRAICTGHQAGELAANFCRAPARWEVLAAGYDAWVCAGVLADAAVLQATYAAAQTVSRWGRNRLPVPIGDRSSIST